MPENTDLTQATNFLQQMDVADMMSSMAMAIANAQQKLDDNSISQLEALIDTKVGDKSLLELGFYPAFYAFDYADISASVNLKIALKESSSLDIHVDGSYERNVDFDKEKHYQGYLNKTSAKRKEYKKTKDLVIAANRDRKVKIESNEYKLNQSSGSISMLEDFAASTRNEQKIERVESHTKNETNLEKTSATNQASIIKNEGYLVLSNSLKHTSNYGVLRIDINDYNLTPPKDITYANNKNFELKTNLDETKNHLPTNLNSASTTIKTLKGNNAEEFVVYFELDSHSYEEDYKKANVTNENLEEPITLLKQILLLDSNSHVTITGHTDSTGKNNYNKDLSERRANEIRTLLSSDNMLGKITIAYKGEEEANKNSEGVNDTPGKPTPKFRKATITVSSPFDYLFIEGEKIDKENAAPNLQATDNTKFIFLENGPNAGGELQFKYGTKEYKFDFINEKLEEKKVDASYIDSTDFYIEKRFDSYHLLHVESEVTFLFYNNSDEEIAITDESELDINHNVSKDKIYISESHTEKTRFKERNSDRTGTQHLAINASVDVRKARQFEMSVEGNAAISARLKALDAPEGLIKYIKFLKSQ